MSSVARFDKESGKIARRARRKGNIAQLKAYREQILNELEALGTDMVRFQSIAATTRPKMQNGKVIAIDQIQSLQAQQALVNEGMARAA